MGLTEIVLDGKKYVGDAAAQIALYVDKEGELERWRKQGMPCIKQGGKWYYNIEMCMRWHAGEDFNVP